jgi:hypothetical protein
VVFACLSFTEPTGDRLYIGTASGNLCIYGLDDNGRHLPSPITQTFKGSIIAEDGEEAVSLVEIKKGLARRAIEQIGFIKDINSLVILSGKSHLFNAYNLLYSWCHRVYNNIVPPAHVLARYSIT